MKKGILFLMIVIISLFFACGGNIEEKTVYGAEITIEKGINFADVLIDNQKYVGQEIRVDGSISALCKHKGCWLGIVEGEEMLVVTFLDEAFTIPKEAEGKRVSIQGVYSTEFIPDEEHEHAEGHEHKEGEVCAKNDPKLRHRFVTSSVVIYEEK